MNKWQINPSFLDAIDKNSPNIKSGYDQILYSSSTSDAGWRF